jgi:hypothetical protein
VSISSDGSYGYFGFNDGGLPRFRFDNSGSWWIGGGASGNDHITSWSDSLQYIVSSARYHKFTGHGVQVYGDFATYNGSKAFVMDHPTKPDWTLKHASTESPQNGVEYWDRATIGDDGTVIVALPDYFEMLTLPIQRGVALTVIGDAPALVSATDVVDGRFTIRGPAGTVVDWLVHAVRYSADGRLEFAVEEPSSIFWGGQEPPSPAPADQPLEESAA